MIWLVKIVPDPVAFLAELPASMFRPYGVIQLVPDFAWPWLLDVRGLYAFKALLAGLLVCAMIGVKPYPLIALLCALLLTFHQGLVRGFTFVNHQEFALLYSVYVLALFPAAHGFARPRRPHASASPQLYSAALLTMAVLLLLPYCAIAAFRVAHSAPGIFLSHSMAYWLGSLSGLDAGGWSLGLWVLDDPRLVTVVKVGFPLITGFELIAPLCLIWCRLRRLWLTVMIPFHLLSWLLLNIFFWENMLLMAVLWP